MYDFETLKINTGDGSCKLELVPELGGICNRLELPLANGDMIDVIAGLNSREELLKNKYYRGVVLYPYVNRLDAGHYMHNGKCFQFEINEPESNNSLHGFLMYLTPVIRNLEQDLHTAKVTLHYDYDGHIPAYPFPAEIDVTSQLDHSTGLKFTIQVKNAHDHNVPVGIGWHPYFTLGEKVDGLKLKLPEVRRVEVDQRLLPTGRKVELRDFDRFSLIGDRQLDDSLEIIEAPGSTVSTILYADESGFGLDLWQEFDTKCASFRYIHLFIPPDRNSIAIEPVSCGINAFNTGEGLLYLGPGEVFRASCGVRPLYSI